MSKITSKKFFHSKVVLLMSVIILLLISLAASKKFLQSYKVNQEINALKEEIAQLEAGNKEIGQLTEYLQTDFFLEKEARLRLGMRKPGEQVIVIPEEFNQLVKISDNVYNDIASTNPQKWWDYFFGQQTNF